MAGRYRFRSLNKSIRGKKLLVIEMVRINQKIENGITGSRLLNFFIINIIKVNHNKTGKPLSKPFENQWSEKSYSNTRLIGKKQSLNA